MKKAKQSNHHVDQTPTSNSNSYYHHNNYLSKTRRKTKTTPICHENYSPRSKSEGDKGSSERVDQEPNGERNLLMEP